MTGYRQIRIQAETVGGIVATIHDATIPSAIAVIVEIPGAIAEYSDLGFAVPVPVARRRQIARLAEAVVQALVLPAVLLATISFSIAIEIQIPGSSPEHSSSGGNAAIPVACCR